MQRDQQQQLSMQHDVRSSLADLAVPPPAVLCCAVIRYDLEYLSLCSCMVDVEIIDAKNDNQSIFVSAGPEACICSSKVRFCARAAADAAPAAADAASGLRTRVFRQRNTCLQHVPVPELNTCCIAFFVACVTPSLQQSSRLYSTCCRVHLPHSCCSSRGCTSPSPWPPSPHAAGAASRPWGWAQMPLQACCSQAGTQIAPGAAAATQASCLTHWSWPQQAAPRAQQQRRPPTTPRLSTAGLEGHRRCPQAQPLCCPAQQQRQQQLRRWRGPRHWQQRRRLLRQQQRRLLLLPAGAQACTSCRPDSAAGCGVR